MTDSTHGRLFTRAELNRVAMRAAMIASNRDELSRLWKDLGRRPELSDIAREAVEACEKDTPFTFPPDEPMYVLRASRSPIMSVPGSLIAEMQAWQAANPKRVKAPDA